MIRKLAKKSIFLKRLVRNYRFSNNHLPWRAFIEKGDGLLESALSQAEDGKKILIATSVGSYLTGTALESILAVALTLRAAKVGVLLCDGILPACFACWSDIYPDYEKFIKYGPGKDCKYCFNPAYKMFDSLGIEVHRFSNFISPDEIVKAREISSSVPAQEMDKYRMDGIAVGEHALAGTLRFLARGTLEGELYGERIFRQYFNAALLTCFAADNLLKKYNFSSAVFHHGIYVPQGLIGEVCRKKGVRVVNWNPAYRKKCFIFSHHDTYHHTMVTEPVDNWMNMSWDGQKEQKLNKYLKSRWKGTGDWIWFHYKPSFDLKGISEKTGIDFTKPCIGLLTSVMWDAVLHYSSTAFPNMLEWIKSTVQYFINRPDVQLIIRIHPAEIRGTLPSRQPIMKEIIKCFPDLPRNIIVIPPESDVSTYAVMMQCDSVIIYNTKTGVELSAMGMPVVVAGEAWVRNKGYTLDANSPGDYYKILDQLPLKRAMHDEDILKAKKYAYHFFFRRMIPIEFMEPAKGKDPPFTLRLNGIEDLTAGSDKGLDLICNGILDGKDFII